MGECHWQPEHEKALKNHVLAGMSLREAAGAVNSEFNTSFSRDAALGKAWRMGVKSTHKRGKRAATGPRKPRKKATTPQTRPERIRDPFSQRFTAAQPQFIADPLPPGTVALVDLSENGCRWASGHDGTIHLFCDRPQWPGSRYCEHHTAMNTRVDQRRG